MDERISLMADDKEKLVDEILDLRPRLKTLEEENKTLRQENDRLKKQEPAKKPTPDFVKANTPNRKPRFGQKKGHKGFGRPLPTIIHRQVEQTVSTCPDCQGHLGNSLGTTDHVTEDIVPPKAEATRFRHHRYWCGACRKIVTAPPAFDEVPSGRLGPNALAWMTVLKYHHGLPLNKIQSLLNDFAGLSVSQGAIAQCLQRLGTYLKIETDVILQNLREASYKHMDETGWRINGKAHWLWAMVHDIWAYFQIHKSRGKAVAGNLLGPVPRGTVISDFYAVYDRLKTSQQKCLVHLKREIHNHRGQDPPLDFRGPDKILKHLLADAFRLNERRPILSPLVYARRVRRLKDRLFLFATETYSHTFWKRLSKRLLKHHKALFTFLDIPGLPSHNNSAERAIRPHVIIRNRSFQSRTQNGADTHATLTSLLETLRLQKRDTLNPIKTAYLLHRQGFNQPTLFSKI
jgi:transposase